MGFPSLVAIGDATPNEVVRSELHPNSITEKDADVLHAHLSENVGEQTLPVASAGG